jgi:hypothetical protein
MIEYTVRVYKDRTEWFLNGKLHRDNGPAIEWNNGSKEWWLNNELHREDGPAVEYPDGRKFWYLNDVKYTEEKYQKALNSVKELTVKEISEILGYDIKIIKE